MTEQLIQQLLQYGGGVAIIIALAYLFDRVACFMNKDGKEDCDKTITDIDARLTKIETNDLHDLDYMRDKIDKLGEKVNNLENRIIKIETKINKR